MFHAVGLNEMDSREMYSDVAEVSTMEVSASMMTSAEKQRP